MDGRLSSVVSREAHGRISVGIGRLFSKPWLVVGDFMSMDEKSGYVSAYSQIERYPMYKVTRRLQMLKEALWDIEKEYFADLRERIEATQIGFGGSQRVLARADNGRRIIEGVAIVDEVVRLVMDKRKWASIVNICMRQCVIICSGHKSTGVQNGPYDNGLSVDPKCPACAWEDRIPWA
ncbi:hypothetical protein Ancab_007963 [Ancistrocladus abbreviatus]